MVTDHNLIRFYLALTPRQREVLELVSSGHSTRDIAQRLCIEPCAVAWHLTNIYQQLGTLDGVEAIRPSRYLAVRLFGEFFTRHPEMSSCR